MPYNSRFSFFKMLFFSRIILIFLISSVFEYYFSFPHHVLVFSSIGCNLVGLVVARRPIDVYATISTV